MAGLGALILMVKVAGFLSIASNLILVKFDGGNSLILTSLDIQVYRG